MRRGWGAAALCLVTVLTGCSSAAPSTAPVAVPAAAAVDPPTTPGTPTASPTSPDVVAPVPPVPSPTAVAAPPAATPAPDWLGTRPLGEPGAEAAAPQDTPPELLDRRIVSPDLLPPPGDEAFHWTAGPVPDEVLARSTWHDGCPVGPAELRYVTVSFWGFDGLAHTGELLLNADAVEPVVAAFEAMHASRFPIEEVRVIRADELDAAPTGDGNVTTAFSCRQAVGSSRWSQHAYGRAVDINPFHNPYEKGRGSGRVVIPELATAYTDRSRVLPGMIVEDSAVVIAFEEAGWGWGGRWRSLKDWQHFSANGT